MRNSKLIAAWALGILARADRPEIKNDSDEVITSSFESNETVAGFSLLNSTREEEPYAQWLTFSDRWKNDEGGEFPYTNDMARPDRTFHALLHLGQYKGPAEAAKAKLAHAPSKGISQFLRVHLSTTEVKPPPSIDLNTLDLVVRHTKYMVFQEHKDMFLHVNHDMLTNDQQWFDADTDTDRNIFLYGYVLGPHDVTTGTHYFHTYYVYTPSTEAWGTVDRVKSKRKTDASKTPQEHWDENSANWLKLPDSLNWPSVLLRSQLTNESTHDPAAEFPKRSATSKNAVWTTCTEPIKLDQGSMGIQTHIIHGTPVDPENRKVYHTLQIFKATPVNPSIDMLNANSGSTCRFQGLQLTHYGVTGTTPAAQPPMTMDKNLVDQTPISLDNTDLLFHQEYDMAETESQIFDDATEDLFKSPHFKQSLLFTTSGNPLAGRTSKHLYMVFETVEKWFDHTHSEELRQWFDVRNSHDWSKRTDLVNMASQALPLHTSTTPLDKLSAAAKLELQIEQCDPDMTYWQKPWNDKLNAFNEIKKSLEKIQLIDFSQANSRFTKLKQEEALRAETAADV